MRMAKKISIMLLCLLLITLGMGYFLGAAYFQTHFKIGTKINGFDCSMMTLDNAEVLLQRKVSSFAMAVETRNDGVEKVAADDVGLRFVGREHLVNILNWQQDTFWLKPDESGYSLPADCYELDKEALKKEVGKLKCVTDMTDASSAHIVETNDVYQVAAAVKGTKLDVDKATQVIETGIRQWKESVNLEEAGCYVDADEVSEEELQKQCDLLNSIQDTIITYDFGDRKETVDYKTVKQELMKDYQIDRDLVIKFVEKMADTYDTAGTKRKFITYDDRKAEISGGNYGWIIDVEATADALTKLIEKDTIDVVEPVYARKAQSRLKNDVGYSYLEVDTECGKVVLYVDGVPEIETKAKFNGEVKPGFYLMSGKKDAEESGLADVIYFGDSALYRDDREGEQDFDGTDDISGFAANSVRPGYIAVEKNAMDGIYGKLDAKWPIVIYGKKNIAG